MGGIRLWFVLALMLCAACGGKDLADHTDATLLDGSHRDGAVDSGPRSDASTLDASTLDASTADASTADASTADALAADAGATLWRPSPGTTWYWQLSGAIDRGHDVEVYDIDLFDMTDADVAALQTRGVVLICYFSAGSYEEWRPDAAAFPSSALGNPLDGWPGERWLDHRDAGVRAVMQARLDLAVARGCDAVEPDNVDGWDNDPGFPLTREDQIDYVRWLAGEAHARGLSVGLKNALGILPDVIDEFDWALNEECLQFDECDVYAPVIAAGKAVFHVEYRGTVSTLCARVPAGFSSARANLDLDGSRWDGCWER